MNKRIKELYGNALDKAVPYTWHNLDHAEVEKIMKEFAELIVRECINKIETYHIPVGNSAAGEMACEMTYSALKEIRDEIKQHFGVEE